MFKYLKHKIFGLFSSKPEPTPVTTVEVFNPLHASLEPLPAVEEVVPVKKPRASKPTVTPKPKSKPKAKPAAKARANARSKPKTTKSASMKKYEGTYNNPSDDFATVAVMSSYSSSSDDYSSRPSDSYSPPSSNNDSYSGGGGDFGGGGSSGSFD